MVDPDKAISKAREALAQRAELPGMSLMEHLGELRRRIVHSAIYLTVGFIVAWVFRDQLVTFIQAPLNHIGKSLAYTHPIDPLNLKLQVSLLDGAILTSPFILFQVWLLIAPGLYQKERRFVVPLMLCAVALFLGGASFGYYLVLPGALKVLIPVIRCVFPEHEFRFALLVIPIPLGVSKRLVDLSAVQAPHQRDDTHPIFAGPEMLWSCMGPHGEPAAVVDPVQGPELRHHARPQVKA
jgi:hypothetical protein